MIVLTGSELLKEPEKYMPKKEEEKALKKAATKKGLKPGSDEYNAYVYRTLRNQGWIPSTQKKKSQYKILK